MDHTRDEPILVLASSSPRRQELIGSLRLPTEIRTSHADETVEAGSSPAEIVEQLSIRKATAVWEQLRQENRTEHRIVIGSDTIVVLDGEVMGKPADAEDAFRMLRQLQGAVHQVYSGVACIDAANGETLVSHRVTKVKMKPLNDRQIRSYIASGESNDKAGAYAIQGLGATIVEGIEGDYFNVVGLPLALLSDLLDRLNVEVL